MFPVGCLDLQSSRTQASSRSQQELTDGRTDRRTEGRTKGRTDGRAEGQTDGRRDGGRMCAHVLARRRLVSRCTKWTHWDLNPGPSACEADVIPLHHAPTCFMPLAFSALSPNACRRRPQSNLKEDRMRKQTARKTDSQQKLPARKADRRQKQTARETNRPQNQTAHQKTSQTDRPQKQILPNRPQKADRPKKQTAHKNRPPANAARPMAARPSPLHHVPTGPPKAVDFRMCFFCCFLKFETGTPC